MAIPSRRSAWLIVLVFAALLVVGPAAPAQAEFRAAVSFGDSLTHNDLLGLLSGLPQSMYGDDPFEAMFDKARRSGDDLSSYAIGGSVSSNVGIQIDLYELFVTLGVQRRATLIHFEIGGNDFLGEIPLLGASPPGVDPRADAVVDNLLWNMTNDLLRLAASHPTADFILWTVPDVTLTPELWNAITPAEQANIRAHLGRANASILAAGALDRVAVFDSYRALQIVVANPPVLFGQQLVGPPAVGDFDHLFADTIHPTAVTNGIAANGLIQLVNSKWGNAIPFYTPGELADLAHIPH